MGKEINPIKSPRRAYPLAVRRMKEKDQFYTDIHINPVKHGLVEVMKGRPYSTFHQLVEQGIYPQD